MDVKDLYIVDCDNQVNGGEYVGFKTLKEALDYADDRASYSQRNINVYTPKSVYTRTWRGSNEGIEECEDPIKFGSFGHYGDWEECDYEDYYPSYEQVLSECEEA